MRAASRTTPGPVRRLNEDAVLVHEREGILIVADGAGAMQPGAYISGLVVRSIEDSLVGAGDHSAERLEAAVLGAHHLYRVLATADVRLEDATCTSR